MNLTEALAGYSDNGRLTYDTSPAALPTLSMKLSKVPNGTLDGTLEGSFKISRELSGAVALDLAFSAELQPNEDDASIVERKAGTTHVTGTATSGSDSFTVDVTR
jgi:hypothetical protein